MMFLLALFSYLISAADGHNDKEPCNCTYTKRAYEAYSQRHDFKSIFTEQKEILMGVIDPKGEKKNMEVIYIVEKYKDHRNRDLIVCTTFKRYEWVENRNSQNKDCVETRNEQWVEKKGPSVGLFSPWLPVIPAPIKVKWSMKNIENYTSRIEYENNTSLRQDSRECEEGDRE